VYFDYDKDFPDDDRICEEVKELQVRSLVYFEKCFTHCAISNLSVASVSASPISQTWMDMLLEYQELEEMK
jgi:hypothetical protein